MDAQDFVEEATDRLKEFSHNFDSPHQLQDHAIELLQFALGRDFDWREEINGSVAKRYHALIERHTTGEPLPYITGTTEFKDITLTIKRGGFIPRATTEFLVDSAVKVLKKRRSPVAVDAACGIGPIALAMAHEVPKAHVYGTDIATDALKQARANAKRLGLKNTTFLTGSMLAPLPVRLVGKIDVVAAHPPYVAREDVEDLPPELKDFEPVESLTDSEDGLYLIRVLVDEAKDWLKPDGWLMMEVGTYIARPVKTIMTRAGFRDCRSTKGDMPYTRVLVGRPPA